MHEIIFPERWLLVTIVVFNTACYTFIFANNNGNSENIENIMHALFIVQKNCIKVMFFGKVLNAL